MVKIINKCTLILCMILLISCEKEPEKQVLHPEWYWGEAMAMKNGICWIAEPYAVESSNTISPLVSIALSVFSEEGFMREDFGLIRVSKVEGTYPLYESNFFEVSDSTGASFNVLTDDGGVVEDDYDLLEDAPNNHVTITSFNADSKEIKGTFDVTLVIDYPKVNANNPDTLRFSKGEFHTKIIE